MMKKKLSVLLAALLLLTALGGAAAEDQRPCLILNAAARYPRESYSLDLTGRTENIPYLLTVTNTGDAPCPLRLLRCRVGDTRIEDLFQDTVLEAGQSLTFVRFQQFSRDDLLPGTESEGTLGLVEIAFTVEGGENSEYASNEARVSHRVSAAPAAGLPVPGAEFVQIELKVTGAPVHPAGYQAGEKIGCQAQVTNLSSLSLPAVALREISGGETQPRLIEEIAGLAPGEQRTLAFTHMVDEEDLARGYVYSAVSAAWTDPVTQEALTGVSAPVVAMTLRGLENPRPAGDGIRLTATLESTPGSGSCFVPGETARISLRAVNVSSSALNQIALLDLSPDAAPGALAEIPSLMPGEEAKADLYYTVTELDALLGRICCFAAAKAADVYGNQEIYVSEPLTAPAGRAQADEGPLSEADGIAALNTARGLTLIQQETSKPAQGGAYKAGETVSYEIIVFHGESEGVWDVKVCSSLADGPVGRAEQLRPADFARFSFEHTVTEAEENAGCVVSWAFAEAEQNGRFLGLCRAGAPTVSPAGSGNADSQGGFALPLNGEGCSLTLLAKGANAAEYSQHLCARHAEIYKAVNELTAAAETEEALAAAWERAAALWTEDLEALYGEYLAAASGTARMAVIQEKAACFASLESERALMDRIYAAAPAQAARIAAEEAMRRCLELCGDGHSAPAPRTDSLFRDGLDKIVSAGAAEDCGRMTMLNQDETVRYRDTLCALHSTVEQAALALLETAEEGQSARGLWFAALRTILKAQYEKGGEEIRSAAEVYVLRQDSYLAARAETLALLYPGDLGTALEAAAQSAARCVLALCREGLN